MAASLDPSTILAVGTAYGATVTKLVDLVRNFVGNTTVTENGQQKEVPKGPKWLWQLLAFAFGVVIAFGWDINAFEAAGRWDFLTHLVTGLAIGGAGSGYHEVFDALSGIAKSNKASAGAVT